MRLQNFLLVEFIMSETSKSYKLKSNITESFIAL
jgi:hypothetical protein